MFEQHSSQPAGSVEHGSTSPVKPSWAALALISITALSLVVGVVGMVSEQSKPAPTSAKGGESSGESLVSKIATNLQQETRLALLDLVGPITMDIHEAGSLFESESNALGVRKALDKIAEDDNIKGVLLRINSPGGTVGMSQELNAAVTRVSQKKPVVAYFVDVAASGGYYTACAADKIVTNPGTLTGSIGVIISTLNFHQLMQQKLGVKATTIKSGTFKDILSPYRETRADEIALIQQMIDQSYQQFLGSVIAGRTRYISNPAEKAQRIASIKAIADGRIVLGENAVKVGLADETGDIIAAENLLNTLAKKRFNIHSKKNLPLKPYTEGGHLIDWLLSSSKGNLPLQGALPPLINSLQPAVPMTLSHPNQLLWVME